MPSVRDHTPLILAGGLGTRLSRVLPDRPKALAPVGNRAFITFLLDELVQTGFEEALVCVGFQADTLEKALGQRHDGLRLRYVREEVLLGTGGALRLALPWIPSAWCLVLNGDSYCGVNLGDFLEWHGRRREPVGLVLTEVPDGSRYGLVALDEADHVGGFHEKDPAAGAGWINAGIYSFPTHLVESLPPEQPLSLEKDVFPRWLQLGMAGYRSTGPFIDIGTPDSYCKAEDFFRDLGRL